MSAACNSRMSLLKGKVFQVSPCSEIFPMGDFMQRTLLEHSEPILGALLNEQKHLLSACGQSKYKNILL